MAQEILGFVLLTGRFALFSHPVVPFITECLWQKLKTVAAQANLACAKTTAVDALMMAEWPWPPPRRPRPTWRRRCGWRSPSRAALQVAEEGQAGAGGAW